MMRRFRVGKFLVLERDGRGDIRLVDDGWPQPRAMLIPRSELATFLRAYSELLDADELDVMEAMDPPRLVPA